MTNIKFFLQTEQAKANAVLLACTSCHCHRGEDPEGTQPPGAGVQPSEAWPYIHCFYPLRPNRLLLFFKSWWSEHHKHGFGVVTKYCPRCGSCLGSGQLQFPHQGCPGFVPQHRKLLGYANPLPLGRIPGQLWLSGQPGLEMLLAVALGRCGSEQGDVEVNKELAEGKGSGCRSPPGSVARAPFEDWLFPKCLESQTVQQFLKSSIAHGCILHWPGVSGLCLPQELVPTLGFR